MNIVKPPVMPPTATMTPSSPPSTFEPCFDRVRPVLDRCRGFFGDADRTGREIDELFLIAKQAILLFAPMRLIMSS